MEVTRLRALIPKAPDEPEEHFASVPMKKLLKFMHLQPLYQLYYLKHLHCLKHTSQVGNSSPVGTPTPGSPSSTPPPLCIRELPSSTTQVTISSSKFSLLLINLLTILSYFRST